MRIKELPSTIIRSVKELWQKELNEPHIQI
jgi:hypothetical protein